MSAAKEGEQQVVVWTSQLGQDAWVAQHIHKHKRGGYFVDIGAHDGKSLSNTYAFEKYYGWTGICVEPMPDKFPLLKAARPNSICLDVCAYNTDDGTVDFLLADPNKEDGMYSGVQSDLTHQGVHGKIQKTKTLTLTTILDRSGAPKFIDFLSLDTEGSELKILQALDWNKYSFGAITVEHNYHQPARSNIGELLKSKGYVLATEMAWDDIYRPK